MQYSRNEIFVWLDKYEKISRFRYFVKKCAEDRQVAKPYEPWLVCFMVKYEIL